MIEAVAVSPPSLYVLLPMALVIQCAALGIGWRMLAPRHAIFRAQFVLIGGIVAAATAWAGFAGRGPTLIAALTGMSLLFDAAMLLPALTIVPLLERSMQHARQPIDTSSTHSLDGRTTMDVILYALSVIALLAVPVALMPLSLPKPLWLGAIMAIGFVITLAMGALRRFLVARWPGAFSKHGP